MDIVVFALFLAAATIFAIETVNSRALVPAGLLLMAIAFTIGAWYNVA